MRSQKGFSLVELLLVIGVILALSLLEFQKIRVGAEQARSKTAGEDLGVLIEATRQHVGRHAVDYQNINDASRPAMFPATCAQVDADTCKLDLAVLSRESWVGGGWQPANVATKSNYSVFVKRVAPPSGAASVNDYNVEAFIRTDDAWTQGATILWSDLGAAVKQAGESAGMVQNGAATGLYGAWSVPIGRYPGMAEGQLAGVVKVQASTMNQYVKVNGSVAMRGALNMGNYRVNNVNDIQMTGQASLPRQGVGVSPMVSSLAPNWVLKSVYNVADYDADNVAGSVPVPVCADSDASNGVPKILVKMSALKDETVGGMSSGTGVGPSDTQAQQQAKLTPSYGGWNVYALEDTGAKVWRTYIRRYYDSGHVPGEALAEVYCYYP
jgi:prepilin-type N-terminal cleavage/methylation domain-containing protein